MNAKLALGLATAIPITYAIVFLLFALSAVLSWWTPGEGLIERVFLLHGLMMLLQIVLLAVYLRHLFLNHQLTSSQRTTWAVGMILASLIAMPVYWFYHVLNEEGTT
jgi:hypothetical protein